MNHAGMTCEKNGSLGTETYGSFRKKPVVIEAYRFNNYCGSRGERPRWLTDAVDAGKVWFQSHGTPYLTICTLEGNMRADIGDWIIKGVKGEIYACKADIFEMTYERASAGAAQASSLSDAEIVERVEDEVGMGHNGWDFVKPEDLVAAFRLALSQQKRTS